MGRRDAPTIIAGITVIIIIKLTLYLLLIPALTITIPIRYHYITLENLEISMLPEVLYLFMTKKETNLAKM